MKKLDPESSGSDLGYRPRLLHCLRTASGSPLDQS